jgi:hypothetical protein
MAICTDLLTNPFILAIKMVGDYTKSIKFSAEQSAQVVKSSSASHFDSLLMDPKKSDEPSQ